jgi:hypothetical protein
MFVAAMPFRLVSLSPRRRRVRRRESRRPSTRLRSRTVNDRFQLRLPVFRSEPKDGCEKLLQLLSRTPNETAVERRNYACHFALISFRL